METNTFNFLKEHPSEEKSEPVNLVWNGTTIRSLSDLREHFIPEELLRAHMNHSLVPWLRQHYYDEEADRIENVRMEDPDCLKTLCKILKITSELEKHLSEEERQILQKKRETLSRFTEDDNILSNAACAATNQEELARLLDAGCKQIYLCDNTFSLPLRKSGIHYIGVGPVAIENAYTREQYEKAGIRVDGISLPESVSDEKNAQAKHAANANGYDDYAENHSPLAAAFHEKLKAPKLFDYCDLPNNTSIVSEFFKSRSACEKARDNCLKNAYWEAKNYFDINSTKAVSRKAADFYSKRLEQVFIPVIDRLELLCKMQNQTSAFTSLRKKINDSHENLLKAFETEILDNRDYYSMYDYNYFLEQTSIEKHDFRVSDDVFFKLIETVVADNIEYTIEGIFEPINEMEKDVNDYANTFFGAALSKYKAYTDEIETLIDSIGHGLPPFNKDETINDYLERMCLKKAV
ncbi:MAG: hypothetical protein SO130_03965 [Agathobacter sp.]|nr:hypothetical protein [Agathobacter sp.]